MKLWNLRPKSRTLYMTIGLVVFLVIAYFFIVPTVVAHQYFSRLQPKTTRAKTDLRALSSGQNVVFFDDPDITLAKRRTLIETAISSLHRAQHSLEDVEHANNPPGLPGNGFAGQYHRAQIRKERTANAVRQSKQVLNEYGAALGYIDAYTEPQLYLDEQLSYVNKIQDFNGLMGRDSNMTAVAAHLQESHDQLAALTPPSDFAPLHDDMLQTLTQASTAFQRLGYGLNHSSDADTYGAVAALENLALKTDVDDKELLTNLAQSSPLLLQLADLPEKIENSEQY